MLGTSRKYAQALLEHMDAERITRRVGDARVLAERKLRVSTLSGLPQERSETPPLSF